MALKKHKRFMAVTLLSGTVEAADPAAVEKKIDDALGTFSFLNDFQITLKIREIKPLKFLEVKDGDRRK